MAIKRFNEPEKAPEGTPEGKNSTSMFTPFKPAEDKRKAALGERVYSQGQDSQESLAEAEAEFKRVAGDVERAMPMIQELVQLHARMTAMPTASTLRMFTKKIEEIAQDPADSRAVITMSMAFIAYLQSRMGN